MSACSAERVSHSLVHVSYPLVHAQSPGGDRRAVAFRRLRITHFLLPTPATWQKNGRNPKARPKSGGGNQMKIARRWRENLIGESLISSHRGNVNSFCRILPTNRHLILQWTDFPRKFFQDVACDSLGSIRIRLASGFGERPWWPTRMPSQRWVERSFSRRSEIIALVARRGVFAAGCLGFQVVLRGSFAAAIIGESAPAIVRHGVRDDLNRRALKTALIVR